MTADIDDRNAAMLVHLQLVGVRLSVYEDPSRCDAAVAHLLSAPQQIRDNTLRLTGVDIDAFVADLKQLAASRINEGTTRCS